MTADPVTMMFYGVICGALAAFAPAFGKGLRRIMIGAVVGAVAAIILPFLRAAMGI